MDHREAVPRATAEDVAEVAPTTPLAQLLIRGVAKRVEAVAREVAREVEVTAGASSLVAVRKARATRRSRSVLRISLTCCLVAKSRPPPLAQVMISWPWSVAILRLKMTPSLLRMMLSLWRTMPS